MEIGGSIGEGFSASVSFWRALREGELANSALELRRLELELVGLMSCEVDDRNPRGSGSEDNEAAVFSWRISRGFLVRGAGTPWSLQYRESCSVFDGDRYFSARSTIEVVFSSFNLAPPSRNLSESLSEVFPETGDEDLSAPLWDDSECEGEESLEGSSWDGDLDPLYLLVDEGFPASRATAAVAFCSPDIAAPTEARPSLDIILRSMSAGRRLGLTPLAISWRLICWII